MQENVCLSALQCNKTLVLLMMNGCVWRASCSEVWNEVFVKSLWSMTEQEDFASESLCVSEGPKMHYGRKKDGIKTLVDAHFSHSLIQCNIMCSALICSNYLSWTNFWFTCRSLIFSLCVFLSRKFAAGSPQYFKMSWRKPQWSETYSFCTV